MKPRIAICNIFDQDADRLLDFAVLNGFEGIDWTIGMGQSEKAFVSQMEKLRGMEVRFHCAFPGIDFAYADSRSESSMEVLTQTIERIALIGRRHLTVHTGFVHVSTGELDLKKAMSNLTILVERGVDCGVCISLENLSSHWTSDPELFAELIAHSGAGVTLDIGHVHASNSPDQVRTACERYILPHKNKIMNAHIYHTELEGSGHVAPANLEDIYDRLELLKEVASCDWWVMELKNTRDILHTKGLLTHYINAAFDSPLLDEEEIKTPPSNCAEGLNRHF